MTPGSGTAIWSLRRDELCASDLSVPTLILDEGPPQVILLGGWSFGKDSCHNL